MDAILNSQFFNIFTVALGLGFVIFIHELGHFLVAKWNHVKVEMFSIGFGPALLSYRKGLGVRLGSTGAEYEKWLATQPPGTESLDPSQSAVGETEYSIRAIPLGGFVKMLGEGEEADREAVKSTDPRAYPNKSVGARMAIISAGVVMNAICGLLFFAWAYGRGGLPVVPARVGGVVAGQPAYAAGLRPGDEVISVNGRNNVDFIMLKRVTAMSAKDEVLHLEVKRPGVAEPLTFNVEPVLNDAAETKTMGIAMPGGLKLSSTPFQAPAGMLDSATVEGLKSGDTVKAAGAEGEKLTAVSNELELSRLLSELRGQPVVIEVAREKSEGSGSNLAQVTLPPVLFVDFGFALEMGPVVAIQPDSPALKAGFQVGDRILAVEGVETLDPVRLPSYLFEKAGEPVNVRVARAEGGKPAAEVELVVTPARQSSWVEPSFQNEPLDVAELGLAYKVVPKIASVEPGSPAARAQLKPGDVIKQVTLTDRAIDGAKPEEVTVDLNDSYTWAAFFSVLQQLPRDEVGFLVNNATEPVRLTPDAVPGWYYPQRGLMLKTEYEPMPALGFTAAVRRGLGDTYDTITSIYGMFRSLIQRQISPKALGGPIMIADLASQTARAGLVPFLQFLGMLSLNLAVINFLPIPPLDGGQMAFLIAEKLRGKPLPERAQAAGTIAGLAFVLGLMVLLFYQDIMRYFI